MQVWIYKDFKSSVETIFRDPRHILIHETSDSFHRVRLCKKKAVLTFILGALFIWIQALS